MVSPASAAQKKKEKKEKSTFAMQSSAASHLSPTCHPSVTRLSPALSFRFSMGGDFTNGKQMD